MATEAEVILGRGEGLDALLIRARAGDGDALAGLIEVYRERLRNRADRHLDRRMRSKISPSDLVQESLVQAVSDLDAFRGSSLVEFSAWLEGILDHRIANTRRCFMETSKRNVRRELPIGADSRVRESLANLPGECTPASEAARRLERREALRIAINRLPDEQREVLRLRYQDELSFRQIGERLDLSEGRANRIHAGALAELLDDLRPGHDPR